jgi:hypothetical protein
MFEHWVFDRLNRIQGEQLVILGDPQRLVRAGAMAVDGRTKENGSLPRLWALGMIYSRPFPRAII